MSSTFLRALAAATVLSAATVGVARAETSVGISIGINQPGVYGRINIGDVPPPALVYAQPVVIAQPAVVVPRQPIYLYVPPAHQQNWKLYCGRYNACGQPVYFVRDEWVRERYTQAHPGWDRGRGRGHDKHGHDDRGHGPDHGPGKGRGPDHDRGDRGDHDRR